MIRDKRKKTYHSIDKDHTANCLDNYFLLSFVKYELYFNKYLRIFVRFPNE